MMLLWGILMMFCKLFLQIFYFLLIVVNKFDGRIDNYSVLGFTFTYFR
jgi:hypothetical protein